VPIIITEYVGPAFDNADNVQYRFIECPWCEIPQGFRFTSTEHCSDCNRAIIDGLKLMLNDRYRIAYHRGTVSKAGIFMTDPLKRRF
jgi:hypothetical protein